MKHGFAKVFLHQPSRICTVHSGCRVGNSRNKDYGCRVGNSRNKDELQYDTVLTVLPPKHLLALPRRL